MDHPNVTEAIIRKVKQYADLVRTRLVVRDIILYGSYVNHTYREDSDIDVAVVVDGIQGDFLKTSAQLHKLTRGIDDRIEPVLLDSENDQSGFLEQIRSQGKSV